MAPSVAWSRPGSAHESTAKTPSPFEEFFCSDYSEEQLAP